MKKVTAIFDIGKTNKKFFLFDKNFREVYRDYQQFNEIKDDEGYPADNLEEIQKWIKSLIDQFLKSNKYDIDTINFSTYGASFVHLDKNGNALTPLYNYSKPIDSQLLEPFYEKYGGKDKLALETGSPPAGLLNSGIQLYWLKKTKPEIFAKTEHSLHLPQYFSFLFTGIPLSDYTSIGCHTMLWNYYKKDYHDWVYKEEIDQKLAPVVSPANSLNIRHNGKTIKTGAGIHDSSAALLPYLKADAKPFVLLSTGTWCITLNPFSNETLKISEMENDCLAYMSVEGRQIKAARLFLGNEYKIQTQKLHDHFGKPKGYHRQIKFDVEIYKKLKDSFSPMYHFESLHIKRDQPKNTVLQVFNSFEEAYHQLMIELVALQVQSTSLVLADSNIKKLYIDGGFANNDIFVRLITLNFPRYKVRTTKNSSGSAVGAAMVISNMKIPDNFLKKEYGLKKHKPIIL